MSDLRKTTYGFLINSSAINIKTGESYNLSNAIEAVYVKKNFVENVFPLYVIKLLVTSEMRDILRDNEISLHLKISNYELSETTTMIESNDNTISALSVCFEDDIRIYQKPYTATATKNETDSNDATTLVNSVPYIAYEMVGIPEKCISKNEQSMNFVLENAELADIVTFMLANEVSDSTDLYIQDTSNKTVYDNIIIPPMSMTQAINYLDGAYSGFYKNNANLFIDDNSIYLYDPVEPNLEIQNTIEISIITKEATGDVNYQIPEIDELGNIKLNYKTLPSYVDMSKIFNHLIGDYATFYYYDNNFNLSYRSEKNPDSFVKTRYFWQPIKETSYLAAKHSQGISIGISGVIPDLITPRTNLKIVSSEYSQFEGEYSINQINYGLTSNDREHYTNTIVLTAIKK